MSKPCTRREEVYLSFKRLDDGVGVKGLRFGNAKRKAKSEECFYCAES